MAFRNTRIYLLPHHECKPILRLTDSGMKLLKLRIMMIAVVVMVLLLFALLSDLFAPRSELFGLLGDDRMDRRAHLRP